MRKCLIVLLLVGRALPALAAKTMTVEQVEQLLARFHDKPDGKVAHELEEVQLTERAGPARLARWQAAFPGTRTQQEIMRLTDMSAFLDPPASDVILDPPPDPDTQRHMLWMAEQYVAATLPHLPNLLAIRETTRFLAPSSSADSDSPGAKPLQWAGTSSQTLSYRDGRELLSDPAGTQENDPASNPAIEGEFGPMLSQLIGDVLGSEAHFLRWEQGISDPAAVFHYEVPADGSHFEVNTTIGEKAKTLHPPYHGEIEIDPETGAILRLSEIATMPPPYETQRAAIEIEYAPVMIGGRSYICPVKGVAFLRIAVEGGQHRASLLMQTRLSDVTVTHYRELQSEHRIVVNVPPAGETKGERP